MKTPLLLLLPCIYLGGCISHTQLTNQDQFAEVNAHGKDFHAYVTVGVNRDSATHSANNVAIDRDSVRWTEPDSKIVHAVSLQSMRNIRFMKHWRGTLDGAVVGAIPGAYLLFAGSVLKSNIDGPDYSGTATGIQTVGVISMFVGAILGSITGAIIGHASDFNAYADPIVTAPNVMYGELATCLYVGALSWNYERMVSPDISVRFGMGIGWFWIVHAQFDAQLMINFFTSPGPSKMEVGMGFCTAIPSRPYTSSWIDAFSPSLSPSLAIGYRYQSPDGGFLFRIGAAWSYGLGLPLQVSLGKAF